MSAKALAFAALCALFAACAKPQPWAPVKKRLCATCARTKLPFNVPKRGVALGFARAGDPRASWIVVDLDRQALNRLTTGFDIMSNTTNLLTRREEELGDKRGRRLIALANQVWSADLGVSGGPGNGYVWDLYLFDGAAIRHDYGDGKPGGAAAQELETLLETPAAK